MIPTTGAALTSEEPTSCAERRSAHADLRSRGRARPLKRGRVRVRGRIGHPAPTSPATSSRAAPRPSGPSCAAPHPPRRSRRCRRGAGSCRAGACRSEGRRPRAACTATFGSRAARSWRSGRNEFTSPGCVRERPSSAMSAEPRAAGLSSSSPRRRSSSFCRKRNCAIARYACARDAVVRSRAPPPRSPRPTASGAARARARRRPARGRPPRQPPRRASRRLKRARRRADVPRRRPEQPAGSLLLEDVRRPAGHARAGEHRRRQRRRDLRDVEDERRVVLDVRLERPLGMARARAPRAPPPRAARAISICGEPSSRAVRLRMPRARVLRAVDAVAEAHDALARVERVADPLLRVAHRRDLLEHRLHVRGRAAVQRAGERADGRRQRGAAVRARRGGDARGERRCVEAVLGGADPVRVDRLHVPRVGLAAPLEEELLGRRAAAADDLVGDRVRRAVGERARSGRRCPSSATERRPRSSRACSSEISLSLPSPQCPARRAVSAWRSAGALPVRPAGSYGSGSGMTESRSSSTRRPQTRSYGYAADELLDVDAAVAEHAAFAIGLRDLGLDRDDALEPGLEVRDLAHPYRTLPERDSASVQVRSAAPMAHRVTLIPGDGTGPELTEATRRVLEATGVDFDWDVRAGRRRRDGGGGNAAPRGDARVGQGERRRAEGADHDARSAPASAPSTSRSATSSSSTRACARARRTRASARATRTSTSSSSARTPRTSTRASSTRPAPSGRARDRDAERAAAEADRRGLGHLGEADQRRRRRSGSSASPSSTRGRTAAARSPA